MSDEQSTDESVDSQQESEQQPTDSDQPAAQSDDQSAEQNDQSEEQPAESDQVAGQAEEQPADSDQPVEQAEEPAAAADQATEPSEEQAAESDQPAEQVEEQPADSEQPATAASADDMVAFAGDAASPGGGGTGAQARLPSRQPTRAPRAPVPQAPVKHDFGVRFTFGTTEPGLLAKGLYLFEIRADDGSSLAAHGWSSVSVTVPLVFNFSLSQITRSGEKSPSFDFLVDLRWLPFSTTSEGTPADPNDTDYTDMIAKDSRIVTTLRPKDNNTYYLTIPPPKGTAVTKISLDCSIAIADDVVGAPSTDENDFIAALLNRGKNLEQLVEKGPPQQVKDGTFLYEVKYYGGFSIQATVLP